MECHTIRAKRGTTWTICLGASRPSPERRQIDAVDAVLQGCEDERIRPGEGPLVINQGNQAPITRNIQAPWLISSLVIKLVDNLVIKLPYCESFFSQGTFSRC